MQHIIETEEIDMANDCNNVFVVKHHDPAMLDRFEKAFKDGGLFNEFFPIPEELRNADSPCRDEALRASNIEKYGAECWYEWAIENWGNKWDAGDGDGEITRQGNELTGWFVSAWGPPAEAFIKLGGLGFTYKLTYDEPGVGFIGVISWDGKTLRDKCYDFDFDKLKEQGREWKRVIPKEFHGRVGQHYLDWLKWRE